jgi:hypothetical protein
VHPTCWDFKKKSCQSKRLVVVAPVLCAADGSIKFIPPKLNFFLLRILAGQI